MLGVLFDNKLTMAACVHEMVVSATLKTRAILRTRRGMTISGLIQMYKSQVL